MTCSSTFLKYPLSVLTETPTTYILMYRNTSSTAFTTVRCFKFKKKVFCIVHHLAAEFRQNCRAPLFMTRKWARAVASPTDILRRASRVPSPRTCSAAVLRGIRTSSRGNERQWCSCLWIELYDNAKYHYRKKYYPCINIQLWKFSWLLPSIARCSFHFALQ